MPLLAARNLHKTYRLGRVNVPVLRGASIEIEPGECVAILGASGSGKSTLMHLLGGLDRPDKEPRLATRDLNCAACGYGLRGVAGITCPECSAPFQYVTHETRCVSAFSNAEVDDYRAATVGFVFQFYHLLPELTVQENVSAGAMIRYGHFGYARQRTAVAQAAARLLESFGLGHRLKHRPAELSGGERQRVAIARALINDPPILLADEPTGNLDRKTGAAILDALAEHRARTHRTFVLVTHDREVAARADRIVSLQDGQIAEGAA